MRLQNRFQNLFLLKISLVIALTIIFFTSPQVTFSQNKYNLEQFKNESFDFIKQPTKWESSDWLKLGITGAVTFLAMQIDEPVRNEMLTNRNYVKCFPIEAGRMYGELYSPIAFSGLFAAYGMLSNDSKSTKIGYEIMQTTIYAGAVTTALKLAFGRARPFRNEGANNFGNWFLKDDSFHSLPSGHTTIAFSISTVLAKNSKSNWVKAICYLPAILTAASRVYHDKHWVSDVFLGGVIGYTVGSWVTSKHDENELLQINSPQQFSIVIPLNKFF